MAVSACNVTGFLPPAGLLSLRASAHSRIAGTVCNSWRKKVTFDGFPMNAAGGHYPSHGLLPRGCRLYTNGTHLSRHGMPVLALGGDDTEIVSVQELGDGSTLYTFDSPPPYDSPQTAPASSRPESSIATSRLSSTFQKRSPIPKLSQKHPHLATPRLPHRPHTSPPPTPVTAAGPFSGNGALSTKTKEDASHAPRPASSFKRRSPIPPGATRARRKTDPLTSETDVASTKLNSTTAAETTTTSPQLRRPPSRFVRRSPIPKPADGSSSAALGVRPVASLGGPAFEAARRSAATATLSGPDSSEDEATDNEADKPPKKAMRRGRKPAAAAADGESNGAGAGEEKAKGRGRGRRKAVEKKEEAVEQPVVLQHPLPSRLASSFSRRSPIPARAPLRVVAKQEVTEEEEVKAKKRRGRKPAAVKKMESVEGSLPASAGGVKLANSDAPNEEPEYLSLLDSTHAKLKEMAKAKGIKRWSMMQKMELIWHILQADYPGKYIL